MNCEPKWHWDARTVTMRCAAGHAGYECRCGGRTPSVADMKMFHGVNRQAPVMSDAAIRRVLVTARRLAFEMHPWRDQRQFDVAHAALQFAAPRLSIGRPWPVLGAFAPDGKRSGQFVDDSEHLQILVSNDLDDETTAIVIFHEAKHCQDFGAGRVPYSEGAAEGFAQYLLKDWRQWMATHALR